MFWSRQFVSDDMRQWILDCFDWFDEKFEPPGHPIVSTKAYFTASAGTDNNTAKQVLDDIKRHMNFDHPIELVPLDVLPAEYRHEYQSLSSVAGTFEKIGNSSVIRYDPEQMNRPIQFINLMAHELMHACLDDVVAEVPGGEEAHELATDLGCIIAGFGVFQLQAADDAGWFGYMTQQSRAFALAVFLQRRNLGLETVSPFLSPRCKRLVSKAMKAL